jgi:uncharacterized protein (DUF1778 family)
MSSSFITCLPDCSIRRALDHVRHCDPLERKIPGAKVGGAQGLWLLARIAGPPMAAMRRVVPRAVVGQFQTFRHAANFRHQYVNCTVRVASCFPSDYNEPYFFRNEGEPIMSTVAQPHERIDLRTSPEIKELIVRAASSVGMSVSAFLLGTAQERAKQILAEKEMITLTSRDWNAFARALDNAEKLRPKLSAAIKHHRNWQQDKR